MTEKRMKWLDISKGIAILLVLIGHGMRDTMRVENGALDYIYRVCYVFHMSFFFFLSGYTLRKSISKYHRAGTMIIKKVKILLVPWFCYTVLIYCIFQVAFLISPIKRVLEGAGYSSLGFLDYLGNAIQINNGWAYHLWFVYVLFIISCLFIVFDIPKTRHIIIYVIVAMSLFTVGHGYYSFLGEWNDLFFHIAIYVPYFFIGYLVNVKKLTEKTKHRTLLLTLEILGITYVLVRAKWFSGFNGNNIAGETKLIRVSVAYLGYMVMPFAMIALCRVSHTIANLQSRVTEQIAWLGEHSFNIYLWHQPFCCAFLGIILYEKLHLGAYLTVSVCIITSIIMGVVITYTKKVINYSLLKLYANNK